jgi:ligand-binding SRPBCC domain-containing protein
MESIKRFNHHFTVNASFDLVTDFHKDPRTLKILTPPPMVVTFNDPGSSSNEAIADFNIWFGPLPIRWVAVISEDETIPGFVDRQVEGPFEFWEHKHTFRKIDPHKTQVVDEIRARPGKLSLNGLISRFMWLTLPMLFAYRAWRTCRELEKKNT